MKRSKPIESLILTIRGRKVVIDADLADIYGVETRTLNQAVKRNAERFPEDFVFRLNTDEKSEVITNCDHLAHLKFAKSLPLAFTEHGAIMAATVLNSPPAVTMSVDKTLLEHDQSLSAIWRKLQPLLQPQSESPRPRRIGFRA